jgi:hypothetical protein
LAERSKHIRCDLIAQHVGRDQGEGNPARSSPPHQRLRAKLYPPGADVVHDPLYVPLAKVVPTVAKAQDVVARDSDAPACLPFEDIGLVAAALPC